MKNHSIHFTKMHGLGNDFVVINNLNQSIDVTKLAIKKLSDRHIGIGFDQLLIIEPSKQADFFCRIFNSDGSEAQQCGNGLRCIARFVHEEQIHTKPSLAIATNAGIFPVLIQDYEHIRVTMGAPIIQEKWLKLSSSAANKLSISVVSMGNPHAILTVDAVDTIATDKFGLEISSHAHFPEGVNVGFMQIMNKDHIRLRTFERGAGETHACGSNACAAAAAGIINGWLTQPVNVEFRYGSLKIEWEGDNHPLHMTGPAARVFNGTLP